MVCPCSLLIRFLGIFDTVAQFGLPGDTNLGKKLSIPETVDYTAHAVAEEEYRLLFPLTSIVNCSRMQDGDSEYRNFSEWYISGDDMAVWLYPHEFREFKGPNYWEKPFAGAHSDIGGSYPDYRSLEALRWFIKTAQAQGVPFRDLTEYADAKQLRDIPASGAHDSRWPYDYLHFRWNWRRIYAGNLPVPAAPCHSAGK